MISMDLRVLRYFLTVAKEQNFTRAAEQLHITQPTLSRQLAAFEQELGVSLFDRTGKTITLTSEGTLEELKPSKERIEGKVTVGCGEFMAVEMLAEICKSFKEKYPLVQIAIHTATADTVYEMLHKGLVDVGMFLEPVDTEGLDYIRIKDSDVWVVGMKPDDPLAAKEVIEKSDIIDKPLILPERLSVQSELANWFGKDFNKLNISFISNLGTNAAIMVSAGLGYSISIRIQSYTSK